MTAATLITRLLADKLGVGMTSAQGESLWAECRAILLEDLQIATIVSVENDTDLENFVPQGTQRDLLYAVGKVFAGRPWPRDDAPASDVQGFLDVVARAVTKRQYAIIG